MIIDYERNYYVGSWRRTPFDASVMPQCICRSGNNSIRLGGFDQGGNVFGFRPFAANDNSRVYIESINDKSGKVDGFLSPQLRLTSNADDAGVWEILPFEHFRGGPLDVGCQIREISSGKFLCSREKSGEIFLSDDSQGLHNIAWELTPDCDEAIGGNIGDIPDWLRDMLMGA